MGRKGGSETRARKDKASYLRRYLKRVRKVYEGWGCTECGKVGPFKFITLGMGEACISKLPGVKGMTLVKVKEHLDRAQRCCRHCSKGLYGRGWACRPKPRKPRILQAGTKMIINGQEFIAIGWSGEYRGYELRSTRAMYHVEKKS